MKRNKNERPMSVLEKCGVTTDIIKHLKKKGIVIVDKIKPNPEPLRSPSEEWFYSIADCFTPPLASTEREVFMNFPQCLSLQILHSVDLMFEVSGLLYDALEKISKNLEKAEERLAATLSILKIFHSCFDNNYLKYDRHLGYHEHEKSPVGHYWHEFENLIVCASKNSGSLEPDRWVNQKKFEILSGPRRLLLSSEYAICCNRMYDRLRDKIPNIDVLSIDLIIEKLKKDFPDFFEEIREYAEKFYRPYQQFINDCKTAKNTKTYEKVMKAKEKSIETIAEIKSKLNEKDRYKFERIVEVIEDLLAIQELEGFIATGVKKGIKNQFVNVLIEGYNQLNSILTSNMNLVKPKYRKRIKQLLGAKDVPSKFIADRKLVSEGEHFFVRSVEELYLKELKRW